MGRPGSVYQSNYQRKNAASFVTLCDFKQGIFPLAAAASLILCPDSKIFGMRIVTAKHTHVAKHSRTWSHLGFLAAAAYK